MIRYIVVGRGRTFLKWRSLRDGTFVFGLWNFGNIFFLLLYVNDDLLFVLQSFSLSPEKTFLQTLTSTRADGQATISAPSAIEVCVANRNAPLYAYIGIRIHIGNTRRRVHSVPRWCVKYYYNNYFWYVRGHYIRTHMARNHAKLSRVTLYRYIILYVLTVLLSQSDIMYVCIPGEKKIIHSPNLYLFNNTASF